MMTDYILIGGASLGGVMALAFLVALVTAKGNPAVAFSVWLTWVKKYWMFGIVVAAGIFTGLVTVAARREVKDEVEDAVADAKAADTIKEKLVEVNSTAKAEIAVAKSKDTEKKKELEEIKKIPDPMERRKRLADMLLILLAVSVFMGCGAKVTMDYISALPKPLEVTEYVGKAQEAPEFVVPMPEGCLYDKMALPAGTLTTDSGEVIDIPGGVLISDCKAEQLILYKSAAERFYVERNQVALVYQSLNQACSQVESMYHARLNEGTTPDLWEQIDFEAGFVAGAAMCIGIDYAIRENQN